MKTIADYKLRATCVTTFVILSSLVATGPGHAQEMPFIDVAHGTVLIHGNYCGPGNRSPRKPVDALDEACMHHDACSPPRGQVATCSCNDRLDREASAIAGDPRYAQSLRETATLVAETAIALPCR